MSKIIKPLVWIGNENTTTASTPFGDLDGLSCVGEGTNEGKWFVSNGSFVDKKHEPELQGYFDGRDGVQKAMEQWYRNKIQAALATK